MAGSHRPGVLCHLRTCRFGSSTCFSYRSSGWAFRSSPSLWPYGAITVAPNARPYRLVRGLHQALRISAWSGESRSTRPSAQSAGRDCADGARLRRSMRPAPDGDLNPRRTRLARLCGRRTLRTRSTLQPLRIPGSAGILSERSVRSLQLPPASARPRRRPHSPSSGIHAGRSPSSCRWPGAPWSSSRRS
jgi:hypothetical protein